MPATDSSLYAEVDKNVEANPDRGLSSAVPSSRCPTAAHRAGASVKKVHRLGAMS